MPPGEGLTFHTPKIYGSFRLRDVGSFDRAESRRDAGGSSRHDSNKQHAENTPRRDPVAAGHVLPKFCEDKSRLIRGRAHAVVRWRRRLGLISHFAH